MCWGVRAGALVSAGAGGALSSLKSGVGMRRRRAGWAEPGKQRTGKRLSGAGTHLPAALCAVCSPQSQVTRCVQVPAPHTPAACPGSGGCPCPQQRESQGIL